MVETESAEASGEPSRLPEVREISFAAPLGWLSAAWTDLRETRYRGAFYGVLFMAMGFAIAVIYATRWQLTLALVAGFFLMGPFVCAGIYELSRQRSRGEPTDLGASLTCWRRNLGSIAFFAAILTFLMVIWARVSVVMFALLSTSSLPTLKGMVAQIFSLANPEFLLIWGGVGLVFATLVFAMSVVAVPLMLDRKADTMISIITSARALLANLGPMLFWAALIVVLIGASLLLWFVPLVLTAPLVGHATWHAYLELVEPAKA